MDYKKWLDEHVGDEVLHDAFTALSSTIFYRQSGWTPDTGRMFLRDYYAIDQKPFHSKFSWQLSQAFILAEIHELVEHFFKAFVKQALRLLLNMQLCHVDVKLTGSRSKMEKILFRRSFYRYELCC